MGLFGQEPAGIGIKHPCRNGQEQAICELDDITLFNSGAKPPYDTRLVIEKGMMPIANSHRRG
jgi:hypothetical protein